ncbi:hypothetical protein MMC30_008834 [Trapelia coarctata]|nr:hypothetical protein [Trapelia coarctata]
MKFPPAKAPGPSPAQDPPNVLRRKFIVATTAIGVAICLLFLLNLLYLYGSTYHQTSRYPAIECLMVDYDGGVVGHSMLQAYNQLQGPSFLTFDVQNISQYPTPDTIVQAVLDRQYWAAIYTNAGASQRLSSALHGGAAARSYDASNALTYVWNEVRYPAVEDSIIQSNLIRLASATQIAWDHINGTQALALLPKGDVAAAQVLFSPIAATNMNIQPMGQGSKVFYNTVSMAMPIIQQFFFILALNGISARFGIFERFPSTVSGILRLIISFIYTIFSSLVMTGYIWAFKEDWAVSSNQFGLTFLLLWFLMHIYFCLIDFAVAFLPPPAMPFIVLTVIFLDITSTNTPFELNPGFFRLGFALPAYEAYSVLVDIWSSSSAQLYISLPVLFSWWVVGLALAFVGHRRRVSLVAHGHTALGTEDSFDNAMIPAAELEKREHVQEQAGGGTGAAGISKVSEHGGSTLNVDRSGDAKEAALQTSASGTSSSSYHGDRVTPDPEVNAGDHKLTAVHGETTKEEV